MQAEPTLTLLALPEDVLWSILRAISDVVDTLHSPLTAARYLAVFAQTSQQLRAVTYRFLPVLLDHCQWRTTAEYKSQWPQVRWETNPLETCSPDTAQRAAKRAKNAKSEIQQKNLMHSWLTCKPTLQPSTRLHLKDIDQNSLKRLFRQLSRALQPWKELYICSHDAQEDFLLTAQELCTAPQCTKKNAADPGFPKPTFVLEDVQLVARDVHKDAAGLATALAAKAATQAAKRHEEHQKRERAFEAAENKRKRVLALLPEHPLLYSSITHNREVQLPDWVVEEAVAVYKSTPATLKAAVQAYKDNVFLAGECQGFSDALEALRVDVHFYKIHKRQHPNCPPHPIGTAPQELYAAAARKALWKLGSGMAWQGPPDMNGVKAEEPWRSVVAHQHIPNGLRQQVLRAMNVPDTTLRKEREVITQIREKVSQQNIQDAVDMHVIAWQDVRENLYRRFYQDQRLYPYTFVAAADQVILVE